MTKNYRRNPYPQAEWREWICGENNPHVVIGGDNYYLSADGLLMPAREETRPRPTCGISSRRPRNREGYSVASIMARNSAVTSGNTPNQSRNAGRAWFNSMPRPLTVALPRARAAASSGVSFGM